MSMEYYTLSQGYAQADEERSSGNHHVRATWTDERYESDEEDGSREKMVRKVNLKREEEVETNDFVTSSSEKVTGERMVMTSNVKYITYGALKHDNGGQGGGRAMPMPSNRYSKGHPKYYRCRG
ncbi:PREDICTED: uncharacterized protein LOC104804792 [Tarenaya hassleriana]|uniref:uncharacterized protein LOC104804792 n=1 Tax=Tarenaya hassleriana TaxID=28532 RepID=UPI00053C51D1|nr:PREDICTED: uncharacterized protein LOC104804792 [Tarenaya hassleriana]